MYTFIYHLSVKTVRSVLNERTKRKGGGGRENETNRRKLEITNSI